MWEICWKYRQEDVEMYCGNMHEQLNEIGIVFWQDQNTNEWTTLNAGCQMCVHMSDYRFSTKRTNENLLREKKSISKEMKNGMWKREGWAEREFASIFQLLLLPFFCGKNLWSLWNFRLLFIAINVIFILWCTFAIANAWCNLFLHAINTPTTSTIWNFKFFLSSHN
jgi:hypothetical protein